MNFKFFACIAILLCITSPVFSLVHHLKINDDTRGSFFIESFGYFANGVLQILCTSEVDYGSKNPADHRLGFIVKHSQVEYTRYIEDNPGEECLLDNQLDYLDYKVVIKDWKSTFQNFTIPSDGTGFYNVYFISCDKVKEISFDLTLTMYNVGPNYLSAGDQPLPSVYLFFFILYVVIIAYWVYYYIIPGRGKQVMAIHYIMTITILLKMGAVFFHSVELHFLSIVGHPGGWTWIYFVFAFAKGLMFFIVLALIGTGWSFIKPFLSDRDKNIFLVVIPLQVISNIAMIILEETAPGSQAWDTWRDIFRLVDIICCIAILLPIVNSVRHLKEAASTDGKAARNVEKLKLFREFYMLVISYIYFTRIIVFLLNSTLLFQWVWISVFVDELCTIAFFALTGYNFRPVENNPYLKLDPEDEINNDKEEASEISTDYSVNTVTNRQ